MHIHSSLFGKSVLDHSRSLLHVFVSTLETLDGRDKATKLVQYVGKLVLLHLKARSHNKTLFAKRLTTTVLALSDARRCFRIGRFIGDLEDLFEGSPLEQLQGAFGLVSDMAENVVWSCGIWCGDRPVPKWVERFERIGDCCWFVEASIVMYYWWKQMHKLNAELNRLKQEARAEAVLEQQQHQRQTNDTVKESNDSAMNGHNNGTIANGIVTSNNTISMNGKQQQMNGTHEKQSNGVTTTTSPSAAATASARLLLQSSQMKRRVLMLQFFKLLGDWIQASIYAFDLDMPWT
jgi:hypothetical protein